MTQIVTRYQFRPVAENHGHLSQAIHASCTTQAKLHTKIVSCLLELGKAVPTRLQMRLRLMLAEIFANMVIHDIVDVHGDTRHLIMSKDWGENHALFTEKIRAAAGQRNSIEVDLDENEITMRIKLCRPFPTFMEKWAEQKKKLHPDYVMTAEDFETPNGRGIMLMASFFVDASYDEVTQTITLTKRWEESDFIEPKEDEE